MPTMPPLAIPPNAPIKFGIDKKRLVIARARDTAYAPGKIELPGEYRLCWEVDGFIQPENELVMTNRVDVDIQTGVATVTIG